MRLVPSAVAPCTAILLLLGTALSTARSETPEAPADRPMAVTTDTAEYCASLARMVAGAPNPPLDARRLLAEGQDMCDRGMIRGGIARLRRALVVERHRPHPPAPPQLEATQNPPAR